MVFHAFYKFILTSRVSSHQVLTVHHCSLDKNPKIVQVIYQKLRECLTMISKHDKAYEAQREKLRELYIVFECFDIMGKHEDKFLI